MRDTNRFFESIVKKEIVQTLQANENYQQLKKWVDTQELEIYYIFSLPRSLSTAIQIAVTEGADGQMNEPFFRKDYNTVHYDAPTDESNFYNGCARIVSHVLKLRLEKDNGPLKLILNDITGDLTEPEFLALLPLCKNYAITVRDPFLQMKSFMIRVGNDHFALCDTKLEDEKALEQCQKPEAANNVKRGINKNRNSWINAQHYTSLLTELASNDPSISLSIIDGYMLQMEPTTFMQTLCERWKIQFTESMINDWKKINSENFCSPVSAGLPRNLELVNGWHGRARNSKGFAPPKEEIVNSDFVDRFSEEYQGYVSEAKEVYTGIMKNPNAIFPKNPDTIAKIKKYNPFVAVVLETSALAVQKNILEVDALSGSRAYSPYLEELKEKSVASNKPQPPSPLRLNP